MSQEKLSSSDFMEAYNDTIPNGFPHTSEPLLQQFKQEHPSLFTHGDLWSIDEHRKKMVDWFQLLKAD